ncbi:ABC transporter ATP-binding protein [Shouchella rhizosphaerae]|uniref:ABC transporter ATP-binding protein n=1 Tax=Shouchella rhizosphaerae TaxID=866786 RepID=UPI003F82216D
MEKRERLLEVDNLHVHFRSSAHTVKAVNGVSFTLHRGETVGIVGESGSGKSVTATSLLRLLPSPPANYPKGVIRYNGEDLLKLPEKRMRSIRGNEISMIFQDPMTSLNPVFTVGDQIMEVIRLHNGLSKKEAKERAEEMLRLVGIPEPKKRLSMYPHEFSGGMRQRVMIAIALACNPKLLIADEPTTALDVTVQAQILTLMKELQQQFNTAIIMITHDLGVVWESCDKVIVMYAGSAVETASAKTLYDNPQHPYTWGVFDSQILSTVSQQERLQPIPGSPPDLRAEMKGCSFANRCPYAKAVCQEKKPELIETEEGHQVACHFQTKDKTLERKERVLA